MTQTIQTFPGQGVYRDSMAMLLLFAVISNVVVTLRNVKPSYTEVIVQLSRNLDWG